MIIIIDSPTIIIDSDRNDAPYREESNVLHDGILPKWEAFACI